MLPRLQKTWEEVIQVHEVLKDVDEESIKAVHVFLLHTFFFGAAVFTFVIGKRNQPSLSTVALLCSFKSQPSLIVPIA